ncbi:MAG: carbohydrate ABC transporter permease [Christensenellales bacterium]|jgi:multiple sugar transport system permease protein
MSVTPNFRKARLGNRKILLRETAVSYAFLLPALLFFTIFVLLPIIQGVITSFYNYSLNTYDFIGLENYRRLMQDEVFLKSVVNTVVIVVGTVPIILIFALYVANTIYQRHAFIRSFFRVVFYLPVVTGTVSVIVVWLFIFNPRVGVLNFVLKSLGVITQNISWLGDPLFALPAIMLVLLTTSIGQPIILYVASLGNIPTELLEAAQIDGANSRQVFRHIKWPLLMPTTLYIVVISTINSFQVFSLIQLMTSGGPFYATSTVMYLLYEKAFTFYEFGYANAMGVLLAIVISIFSLIQFKAFSRDVSY